MIYAQFEVTKAGERRQRSRFGCISKCVPHLSTAAELPFHLGGFTVYADHEPWFDCSTRLIPFPAKLFAL
jgi:hypothetical protein